MAEAKIITIPPKPVEPETYVELRLSHQEAKVLFGLVGCIGGTGEPSSRLTISHTSINGALEINQGASGADHSPRVALDSIYDVLKRVQNG